MRLLLIFPALFFAVLTGVSHSQTMAEMKQDAAGEYEVSDKAMNRAYTKLTGILNEEGKGRLKEAQRAWIAYRDSQAGFDSHHLEGGTMEGLERIGSLNQLTQERTRRLREDFARFESME